jgi:proton glutamate symport protein
MSRTSRIVAALVAGLVSGIALTASGVSASAPIVEALGLVGELWLNALRMTVLPLLVGLLVTGIASTRDTAASGQLAGRSITLFTIFALGSAVLGALVTPILLGVWPVKPESRAALLSGAGAQAAPTDLPLREWFAGVIPVNPFAAAAEGAILPLVVFTVVLGLAAARLEPAVRAPLLGFFQAVVDAMLMVVNWVLWAAPAGIFALAIGVGMQGGLAAAGGITQYLIMMCGLAILITLAMYPIAVIFGRVPMRRFAPAIAPAQTVAFSTQSSLASLPAMLTAAQSVLGIPARVAGIVLPLAVAIFKATSPAVNVAVVIFVAHVSGIHLDIVRVALGVLVAFLTSFGVAGIPGQVSFLTTTVPIAAVMGVPTELLLLLIAVEVIPDIFRTVGNVTGDLTVATILGAGTTSDSRSPEHAPVSERSYDRCRTEQSGTGDSRSIGAVPNLPEVTPWNVRSSPV